MRFLSVWIIVHFVLMTRQQLQPDPDTIEGYKQTLGGVKFRCGFVGSFCDLRFESSVGIQAKTRVSSLYLKLWSSTDYWSFSLSRNVTSKSTHFCLYLRYRLPHPLLHGHVTLHTHSYQPEHERQYRVPFVSADRWSEGWVQLQSSRLHVTVRGDCVNNQCFELDYISVRPGLCEHKVKKSHCGGWSWLYVANEPVGCTDTGEQQTTTEEYEDFSEELTNDEHSAVFSKLQVKTVTSQPISSGFTSEQSITTIVTNRHRPIETIKIEQSIQNNSLEFNVLVMSAVAGGIVGVFVVSLSVFCIYRKFKIALQHTVCQYTPGGSEATSRMFLANSTLENSLSSEPEAKPKPPYANQPVMTDYAITQDACLHQPSKPRMTLVYYSSLDFKGFECAVCQRDILQLKTLQVTQV